MGHNDKNSYIMEQCVKKIKKILIGTLRKGNRKDEMDTLLLCPKGHDPE